MMHFGTEQTHSRKRATLSLASMIDVVFLLLIFFMVATIIRPQEATLTTHLTGRSSQTASLEPQVVRIVMVGDQPEWRIGAHQIQDPEDLQIVMANLAGDAGLTVSPDGNVPVGAGVAVVDAARAAGIESVRWDDLDVP